MFFLSNRLYGVRPSTHFDLYPQEPGWYFLEVGSWTLEIDFHKLPFNKKAQDESPLFPKT